MAAEGNSLFMTTAREAPRSNTRGGGQLIYAPHPITKLSAPCAWPEPNDPIQPSIPVQPTAAFYLSLFAADLAQPKGPFLGSEGFDATFGADFLKEGGKGGGEKGGVTAHIHMALSRGRLRGACPTRPVPMCPLR